MIFYSYVFNGKMNGSVTNRMGTLQFVIKKFPHTIVSMTSKVRVFEEISKPLPTRINTDPIFMYLQVKASSLDLQMPTRGRVAPRLGPAPQLGRQIAGYICHKNDFMFYLSCFIFPL